jgi:hypothetical protein
MCSRRPYLCKPVIPRICIMSACALMPPRGHTPPTHPGGQLRPWRPYRLEDLRSGVFCLDRRDGLSKQPKKQRLHRTMRRCRRGTDMLLLDTRLVRHTSNLPVWRELHLAARDPVARVPAILETQRARFPLRLVLARRPSLPRRPVGISNGHRHIVIVLDRRVWITGHGWARHPHVRIAPWRLCRGIHHRR